LNGTTNRTVRAAFSTAVVRRRAVAPWTTRAVCAACSIGVGLRKAVAFSTAFTRWTALKRPTPSSHPKSPTDRRRAGVLGLGAAVARRR
jgi:hypothetical protein